MKKIHESKNSKKFNATINKVHEEIENAKKSGDYTAVKELERKLHKFYVIKYELGQTALQLKNYYKR